MKRILGLALIASALTACSSTEEVAKADCAFPDKSEAPSWYCEKATSTAQPSYFYLGSSSLKAEPSTQERLAVANATVKLSQELDSSITSLVNEREQINTSAGVSVSKKFVEISSTLMTDTKLTGVRQYESAVDESGQIWVLVGISQADYLDIKQRVIAQSIEDLQQQPLTDAEQTEVFSLKSLLN
ncbi:hypothetical protein VIN01S_22630 [Vibrio inusitatus NBRC 102082]|uniref:LPP20 lipoprotein n=1 Tax=Vibrio inusitatus NBRC 102082 TaxID=1219070 RepID=A0A4Y3HWA6_9VIBR|nr:hypothetical protein [Vibrio inusitatus]GEA51459.1 hypothetical protein VIN01S_22630 [Vibrio inusitatus NBRC 102082]